MIDMGGPLQGRNWFVKSHALGNDYVVVDPGVLDVPLTPPTIRALCDRHRGLGSDGILACVPSSRADVGLRIYNPDGTEAEKSGNGLRIFARFLWDHERVRVPRFTVETPGGVVTCDLEVRDGRVEAIAVDMGVAWFSGVHEVQIAGRVLQLMPVDVGNPHCVVFGAAWTLDDLRRLGPILERHPFFPNRTNVQLAVVTARDRVQVLVWERGAGHTLASGSSATAVAAAAVAAGHTDGAVTIAMEGGTLAITVAPDFAIRMTGPATAVYVGVMAPEFVRLLAARVVTGVNT